MPNPYLSTLHSTFPGPSLPTGWTQVSSSGTLSTESFVSNALRVTAGSSGGFRYYESGPYDLQDSAVNWVRTRHDGTANGFWEITFGENSGAGALYVYANGLALNIVGTGSTYDPVAQAFFGFKWVNATTFEIYTAPDSSGVPGTPTLLTTLNYSTYSPYPDRAFLDVVLGTINGVAGYGELLSVNPTVVASAPTITLTSSTATVNYTQGNSAPAGGSVAISNTGTGTLDGLAVGAITFA